MEFAEEALETTQSNNLGGKIKRATLIRSILENIELMQKRLKEAEASLEKVKIRGKALGTLCMVAKLERHKILVEWIEQQRRAMASERANSIHDAENHDVQGLKKRPKRRSLRNLAPLASRPSQSFDRSGLGEKRKQTRSVLGAIDPSRVSKANRKENPTARQKKNVLTNASQSAQAASIDPGFPKPRSKGTHKLKDAIPPPLRPIHSSKVSKSNGKQHSGLQASGMALLRNLRSFTAIEILGRACLLRASSVRNRRRSLLIFKCAGANFPQMVIFEGSLPNAAMFSCTHRRAIRWHLSPRFVTPASRNS